MAKKTYKSGVEHKNVRFEVKQIEEDDRFFTFEGFASTFGNIDRTDDIIAQGAFADSLRDLKTNARPILAAPEFRKILPCLWQHRFGEPVGSFIEAEENTQGLFVKGILPKDDTFVTSRVVPQMKIGSVQDMSIGFITKRDEFDSDSGIRTLLEIDLLETSLVTIPANPQANITGLKSLPMNDIAVADRATDWDPEGALARVKDYLDSESEPSDDFSQAFLYHDGSEGFGGYKFLVVDVVNDRLTVVPKAVFAAVAELRAGGSKAGIPQEDRVEVLDRVGRIYKRLGLEAPFVDVMAVRIDDLHCLTERQFEKCLLSGPIFSRKVAKFVTRATMDALGTQQRDAEDEAARDAKRVQDFASEIQKLVSRKKKG